MNPSSERILLLYVIETPLASKQYRVRAGAGMCVVNPRPQAGVGENSDALDDEFRPHPNLARLRSLPRASPRSAALAAHTVAD